MTLLTLHTLFAIVLALTCLAPADVAVSTDMWPGDSLKDGEGLAGDGGGEAGLTELWQVVNKLDQTVHTLKKWQK
jgi:hypothetical protein